MDSRRDQQQRVLPVLPDCSNSQPYRAVNDGYWLVTQRICLLFSDSEARPQDGHILCEELSAQARPFHMTEIEIRVSTIHAARYVLVSMFVDPDRTTPHLGELFGICLLFLGN